MREVKAVTASGIYYNGILSEPLEKTKKIIIHIHGLAGSYREHNFYPTMHTEYPKKGIAFLAVEHRGSGSITEFITEGGIVTIGSALERFEDCIEDIQAWVNFASQAGYEEIWLQAHSLGTPKVAYFMDQMKPDNIAGLILLSPSEMIGLVHDPVGQIDFDSMYPEAKQLLAMGKENQILKHKLWETVELSAGTFINFFDKGANTAIFNYADPKLGWGVVNRIKVPVIAITGTKDDGIVTVMESNQAMELLKQELKLSPRVETIVYKGAEHNFEGFEKDITSDVVNFINKPTNLKLIEKYPQ